MLIEAIGAARELGRLHEIAGVLIRHGFGDAVRRLGLADGLERAGRSLHRPDAAELARLDPPAQVRRAMEELGPAFVKLGQVLASRVDLFGPEWTAEFSKLHNQVPAVPLEQLRPQLNADLGGDPEEVFSRFDVEPLAAGSIAQVHRARLKDGTEVVVKIRRPGIRETIEADLRLLDHLAAIAEAQLPALQPYRPRHLARQFARSLRGELDLAAECRHAERIAADLAGLGFVAIPRVHWAHTGERMNVQDFVAGLPGHRVDRLAEQGLDRSLLARRGAHAVLKMIVEDGYFHADPHPGNVFYLPGNRLAFIDFGMVGRLPRRRRDELLQLLLGLVQRDPQSVADVLLDWTDDHHPVSPMRLESEIEAFIDRYHGVPLAELNLGQMLADITVVLREHRLMLPDDLALLIKAFVTLEGMGRGLDPGFHMAGEALPLLQRVVRERYRPKSLASAAWRSLRRALTLAEQLPQDVSRLLRNARRGRLHVGLELAHLRRVGDQVERAANRLALALVVAALIIGSSIVMTVGGGPSIFGLPAFGLLGFVSAVVGGLWLIGSIRSSRHAAPDDA
jgi:ubiquinone biosynthesis protein